jgi:hypothetical protein
MENPLSDSSTSTDSTDNHNWSEDVENQIRNVEYNCKKNSQIAKDRYLLLIEHIKYFRIPVIFFSGINSVFAVGLNSYMSQDSVSVITCMISFLVGMISSIEMYLGLTKRIDLANQTYRDFYLLALKINNVLRLKREHRSELDGRSFLIECVNSYEKIFQGSNIYTEKFEDRLMSNP